MFVKLFLKSYFKSQGDFLVDESATVMMCKLCESARIIPTNGQIKHFLIMVRLFSWYCTGTSGFKYSLLRRYFIKVLHT